MRFLSATVAGLAAATLACAALALPAGLLAQDMTVEGTGAYIPIEQTERSMTDGRTMVFARFGGYVTTDDPASPFHMGSQDCAATSLVSADGVLVYSSGHCASEDPEGDVYWYSFWNDGEDAGYSLTDGTGKFAGLSGGGTTTVLDMGEDGRMFIRWEGGWTRE